MWIGPVLGIALLANPLQASQGGVVEEGKLTASDAAAGDQFGNAVCLSGNTALVGSPFGDGNLPNSGSAYVFTRSGSTWSEQAKLSASDGVALDRFGFSVSLSGDTALIGSPYSDGNLSGAGNVYVFRKNGKLWSEEAKLTASDGSWGDRLGYSCSLSGDTALVGAPYDDAPGGNGADTGSVYMFVRSGTVWSEQAKVSVTNSSQYNEFGSSVSLWGDTALIGARHDSSLNGNWAGAAYVFARSGTIWSEQAQLFANPPQTAGDLFGLSVSIWQDTALIGSPGKNASGLSDAGAAYVWVRSGTVWSYQTELLEGNPAANNNLGTSVSLHGEAALIGAQRAGGDGAAYVFERTNTSWSERARLKASDGAAGDQFGWSVSLWEDTASSGANLDDDAGPDSGSAYVHRLFPEPVTYCTAKTNSCGTLPAMSSSGTPSASAASGFVVSASNARSNKLGILGYSNTGRANAPFQGWILCVNAPLRRTPPTSSGGNPGSCDGAFTIDMNCFASGNCGGNPKPTLRIPGTQVNCQWWGRDSVANGSYLSDALEYFVGP